MDFSTIKSITIPEGNVVQIAVGSKVLWRSSPLPSAYQQVEWIRNQVISTSSGSYIDLGFAFDKAATIYLNFTSEIASSQPFGAAENSGKYRCMISNGSNLSAYGYNGTNYITTTIPGGAKDFELKYELKKGTLKVSNLLTGDVSNNLTGQVEYTMTRNLYLFAQNYNTAARIAGNQKVKAFQYYDKNDTLICDLIPCYRKSDGVIGMYDVVRKIFLTNAGSGSFTKGADV